MQSVLPTDADELLTVRDWLRFAVSRFNGAKLVYGQGTADALGEAAFLILSALELPIDQLEPWLDCRLTMKERERLCQLIKARIETRKPAAYLTNSAWIQDSKFYVDERVIVPRSYVGELICRDALSSVIPETAAVRTVLDLCTGSGCLAILAALAFPNARITATDISPDALEVAARNVTDYELDERITLIKSDIYAAITSARYDLIISNPPYVDAAAVAEFAPEFRAEPKLAHLGGHDGTDLVRRILKDAADHLTETGSIIVEIGRTRETIEKSFPNLPFLWLDTENSEGEVFALAASDL